MEDKVYEEALKEYKVLEQRTGILRENIERYPPGYLTINHKNGAVQYYHVIDDASELGAGKEIRKYIRKKDKQLAVLLAQKSHEIKLLKELEVRKAAVCQLIKAYSGTDPYAIWESYCGERRKIVSSEYVSDARYAEEWQSKPYQPKAFAANASEIYTAKGERVRSKSEKIIADTLEREGIPYRYECPIEISGGVSGRILIHPDFTVLNKRTRKEYFWEHLGMLDDPEYYSNAVRRLEQMAESGILPGKNLIMTAETGTRALSVKVMNIIIREYLI